MGFFSTVQEQTTSNNTLVFGNTKTGKTQEIIKRVLAEEAHTNVLWIAFDNLNFEGKALPTWQIAEPDSWDSFEKNVLTPMRSKTLGASIVVIEGIDIAGEYFKRERIAKLGAAFTQQVYGEIGPKLRETIAILRNGSSSLYLSMSTRTKVDIGGALTTSFSLNNDAISKIMTMCPNLVYTSAKTNREQSGVITSFTYFVQTNPLSAMSFIQGAKS